MTHRDMLEALIEKTELTVRNARAIYRYDFAMPHIGAENMGKTLGKFYHYSNRITYNPGMFNVMFDHMHSNTVPHEVAHLVVAKLYPNAKQAHGPEFRSVAARLGCTDTKAKAQLSQAGVESFIESGKYVPYNCGCKDTKIMTRIQAAKMRAGRSMYTCKSCNQRISVG